MLLSEFIDRTGYQPSAEEYKNIENEYYNFVGDKDAFCKTWRKNNPTKAGQIWRAQKEAQRIDKITRKCEAVILKRVKKAKHLWENIYKMQDDGFSLLDDSIKISLICTGVNARRIMSNLECYSGSPIFRYWAKKVNDSLLYGVTFDVTNVR